MHREEAAGKAEVIGAGSSPSAGQDLARGSRGSSSLAPCGINTLTHARAELGAIADPDPGAGLMVALEISSELEITLDTVLEVVPEIMLEIDPGLMPDNSRCGSWGGRGEGLEGNAGVSSRSWSRSGTTACKGINSRMLSATTIPPGDCKNVGFIPSLLLVPPDFCVRNFHQHVCRTHKLHVQQKELRD
ncbi:hypothetical protein BTVI_119643 [Pitangus sulphuratus]|nr:hypothetical protein BTVI_119643 [Pitangus sulphuratus]